MVNKKQVCFTSNDNVLLELVEINRTTGDSIRSQIERILKGYTVREDVEKK
jgi:hypothetical protein